MARQPATWLVLPIAAETYETILKHEVPRLGIYLTSYIEIPVIIWRREDKRLMIEKMDRQQRTLIRLRDKHASNERGLARKKPPSFYRNARLLAVFTLLAFASTNFYTLSNHAITKQNSHDDEYSHDSSPSSHSWSKRKIANVASRAVPLDQKDNIFLRTGKAPIQSENVNVSSNKLTMRKTVTHRRKHNRLIRGTHLTLAEMNGWPPLQEIVTKDGKIAAHEDISWLLDFAIIGFPKTGTTSMLRHLSEITHMPPSESCSLTDNTGITKLVKDMYSDRNKRLEVIDKNGDVFDDSQLRGLKCPQDLSSDVSLHNYAKYFPKTKLIVGIRHPVRWFESLYNFRVSNVPWKKMLHTTKLTRGCTFGSQGVCGHRANFADYLSQLGKTPMDSAKELDLLSMGLPPVKTPVGKVFLYDVSQLSESEDGIIQSTRFRQDLKDFLGLSVDIPPFPRIDTSGRFNFLEPVKKQTEQDMIDICDSDHDKIRNVLMDKARIASRWMKDYFLESTDVVVSNRDHFIEILDGWNEDPCNVVVSDR